MYCNQSTQDALLQYYLFFVFSDKVNNFSSKIALSQSAELYNKENSVLKKKMEEYKRQRTEALEEVRAPLILQILLI